MTRWINEHRWIFTAITPIIVTVGLWLGSVIAQDIRDKFKAQDEQLIHIQSQLFSIRDNIIGKERYITDREVICSQIARLENNLRQHELKKVH